MIVGYVIMGIVFLYPIAWVIDTVGHMLTDKREPNWKKTHPEQWAAVQRTNAETKALKRQAKGAGR